MTMKIVVGGNAGLFGASPADNPHCHRDDEENNDHAVNLLIVYQG